MRIWELFPDVARRVRQTHEEVGLFGHHDWVHAFRVGEVACRVACTEWWDPGLAHLAGLAGLCHNADRMLACGYRVHLPSIVASCEVMDDLVEYWVGDVVGPKEVRQVVDAVLRHDAKNSPGDSRVLVALMDADRVVNLDVDLFPRSGQYYHDLPVVDYRHFLSDPEATYQNPESVLRDIAYSLDWADPKSPVCVRTRLGKNMAEARVKVFRTFFDALQEQLTEEGMHPYPFEE